MRQSAKVSHFQKVIKKMLPLNKMPVFVKILLVLAILSRVSDALSGFTKSITDGLISLIVNAVVIFLLIKGARFIFTKLKKPNKWQPVIKAIMFFFLCGAIVNMGIILAFLSRFYYDQKSNDLLTEIHMSQALVDKFNDSESAQKLVELKKENQKIEFTVTHLVVPVGILLVSPLIFLLARSMKFKRILLVGSIVLLIYLLIATLPSFL